MANWNSNGYWNRGIEDGGFIWNTDKLFTIKHISEPLYVSDKDTDTLDALKLIVRVALKENPIKFFDKVDPFAFYDTPFLHDAFYFEEPTPKVSLLFFVAEDIGIKDEITEFIAMLYLEEKFQLLEDLKLLVELFSDDVFGVTDFQDLFAFYEYMERFQLFDLELELKAFIEYYEKFGLTDHDPRTAVSDFMIGAIDVDDRAYDWLIPFGLKVDWGNTKVQVMPEAELTTVEIPGVDGTVVEDTTYRDRIFNIVAFSEQGFTTSQKEEIKKKIDRILDSTKHQTKKFTIQASGVSFDVKYSGQADIVEGPSYIKATIPLHTPPYGYDMFPYELIGNGLIWNNGDTFLYPVHRISGPVSNPGFKLGEVDYRWSGYVSSGSTLVVDHGNKTVYIEDDFGKKKNAMTGFSGKFQSIPVDGSMVLTADANTVNHIKTEWRNNLLY